MRLIIIVDPGHREDTPGKCGNGVKEYEFNQCVADLFAKDISKYADEVHFTITNKTHPYSEMNKTGRSKNLSYRTTNANNIYWNAVKKYGKNNFKIVFISIHANAFSDSSVSGYEVFVYKYGGEAHELAKCIHTSAQNILGVGKEIKDRGIKQNGLYVLANTVMPAVLIEHEFYTNPTAAKKLLDPKFRQLCSDHLVKGVLSYANIKEKKGGENKIMVYKVRKSWVDTKSQIGAFNSLNSATELVKQNPGYAVFDENGKQLYPDNTEHWGKPYRDALIKAGLDVQEERYDDNVTRAEMFKMISNAMNLNIPRTEAPKTETSKTETSKTETPKTETSKTETSKTETSKTETSKTETPETETVVIPYNSGYRKIRKFDSDIHIFETAPNNIVDVDMGQNRKLESLSQIVQDKVNVGNEVLAAVNCGFFNWNARPEHYGMYIDEGLYYTPPTSNFIDFIYYKNGKTEIKNMNGYNKSELSKLQKEAYWAIGTSWSLMQNGITNLENSEKFDHSNQKHPRTLFGQKKDGSFVLVVIDGRSKNSVGVTAKQSAEIMKELECFNAVNFDGGGSSTMIVVKNGKPVVVNAPSDGRERAVGSCMIVYNKRII